MPLVKAQQDEKGDWIFEAMAALPGRDLEEEQILPQGLEIDYLLGKGLPSGAGGCVNYDHDSSTIVGVPLDGKINPQGLWLKWKGLKTKFMEKIVEQMKALQEAGSLRRYGMSVEGVVKQFDPVTKTVKRAFIRNVALTPTPVHPGTWVDFAKSLNKDSMVEYRPFDAQSQALRGWVDTVSDITKGLVAIRANPYFYADGTFKVDRDLAYFQDVHGLSPLAAMELARYALSREPSLIKALRALQGGGVAL